MNGQSILAPAGPDGERLADLSWLLFGAGGLIFLVVMALTVVALWGGAFERRLLASRPFILAAGIAFPVIALSALLLHNFSLGRALGLPLPGGGPPLPVEVVGYQFWWEVRYPGTEAVTANEIRLPTGRDVILRVTSTDVIHSLWIPALHGKIDMIPGLVNERRVRAARPGVLRGECAEFCGAQHALMALDVVAQAPDDFAAWLAAQRQPAPAPATPVLAAGRQAFGQAGCGDCHTVRGTQWHGRRGPDLTHVGGRLTIGAGILPNGRGALAGWIAASQDLKPGNHMPSFADALEPAELRALAAWLESLK